MLRPHGAVGAAPTAKKEAFRKLKPGPGLSREAVALDQRLRVRLALASLTAESGFRTVTVRELIRRAGISTSTFYSHYDSIDGCFAAMVGTTIRSVADDIRRLRELGLDPIDGLRTALRFWMGRLAREPMVTEAVFIESSAAGPQVLAEMVAAVRELERLLAQTFEEAPRPAAGTSHLAGGVVAGLVSTVRKTAVAGRAADLRDLADELADWMFSIAHEEVAAFCVPRSRSLKGIIGGHSAPIGAGILPRAPAADAGRRAMEATIRLAASTGLAALTSAKIRKDAGLSRREFEAHFTGVEDCYLDAIESVSGVFVDAACRSAAGVGGWERWVFGMMSALCALAAADRELSRLVLLDVTAVGRPGLLRREELIGRAAAYIREQADPDKRPSELAATASVSAVWRIAETEVAARRSAQLPRVAPAFVYMILAARRAPSAAEPALVPELRVAAGDLEATPLAATA